MGTLYLYEDVELNNKYQDVFISQSVLEEYLSTKTFSTVEGSFYFQMKGTLNLQLSSYSKIPNYIKYVETAGTSYYFIKEYNNYNGIIKINYVIDVWHTYIDKFKIKDGVRNLASTIIGEYADIPYTLIYGDHNYYDEIGSSDVHVNSNYQIFAIGYCYTGEKTVSDVPSHAMQFATMPNSGASTISSYFSFSFSGAVEAVAKMIEAFAQSKQKNDGSNYYFNITNVWIISSQISSLLRINSFTEISGFTPIQVDNIYYHIMTGGTYGSGTVYSYKTPIQTINNKSYICTKIGAGKTAIDIPPRIYKNNMPISYNTAYGNAGVSINIELGNVSVDIAPMMEISMNFSPESMQVAEARQNNAIAGFVNNIIGIGTGIGNAVIGAATGAGAEALGGVVQAGQSIVSMVKTFTDSTNSEVKPNSMVNPVMAIWTGLDAYYNEIVNKTEINRDYKLCGLIVEYPEENKDFTDGNAFDYNVIGYSALTVYGAIPEQYKDAIEQILLNGCRVWQVNKGTLDVFDNLINAPDTINLV